MSKPANEIKSVLRFSNYIVNEAHFIINENFQGNGTSIPIDFDVKNDIEYEADKKSANVTLTVKIFDKMKDKNYPFYFEVKLTGFFQVENAEIPEEKMLIESNAIAILFPYIRALISSYTANSNVSPLILPPINVVKFMKKKHAMTS
jgi:preprotein translocase subunit SecB